MNERGGGRRVWQRTRCPAACLFQVATRKAEPAGGVCVAQVAHGARQMRRRRLQLLILFLLDSPANEEQVVGGGDGLHVTRPIASMVQWLLHVPVRRRGGKIGWPLHRPAQRLDRART